MPQACIVLIVLTATQAHSLIAHYTCQPAKGQEMLLHNTARAACASKRQARAFMATQTPRSSGPQRRVSAIAMAASRCPTLAARPQPSLLRRAAQPGRRAAVPVRAQAAPLIDAAPGKTTLGFIGIGIMGLAMVGWDAGWRRVARPQVSCRGGAAACHRVGLTCRCTAA